MGSRVVLVAPDKFKGSLSASDVASALASGLGRSLPGDWSIREHPLADGGEGTVESIVEALDGEFVTTEVEGPLGDPTDARWGLVHYEGETTAVIEMAAASGYDLIDPDEANPMRATTYGTGELIDEARKRGVGRIIVGLGGSATVDGGLGMARALGYEFYDGNGDEIQYPEGLGKLVEVSDKNVPVSLSEVTVTVCSDVDNPLLGEEGAARVYGPQKGADPGMVETLEGNLERWANVLEEFAGVRVKDREGAGAAGGLGFGLAVLLDGSLVSGAKTVMDVTSFNSVLQDADVLITGEGKIDRQTKYGKTPSAAARRAREHGDPTTLAVCGHRAEGYEELHQAFDVILSVVDRPMSLEEALEESGELLRRAGDEIGRFLTLS